MRFIIVNKRYERFGGTKRASETNNTVSRLACAYALRSISVQVYGTIKRP